MSGTLDRWATATLAAALTCFGGAICYFALIGAFGYRVPNWQIALYVGLVAGRYYGRALDGTTNLRCSDTSTQPQEKM